MNDLLPVVFVVDDDTAVREALRSLIRSVGLRVELFRSAEEFMQKPQLDGPSCLVVDVRLTGMSGLDFQRALNSASFPIPLIFITGHGDIPMTVRALKAGAVEFLTKPFRDQDLLDAIQSALQRDRMRRQHEEEMAALRGRFDSLTDRERDVVLRVAAGLLNKQIAAEFGIAENTVKVHRSHAMDKLQLQSVAELVKLVGRLEQPQRFLVEV
jgi:RNA polymerase sigma factor (sigma-70 family)